MSKNKRRAKYTKWQVVVLTIAYILLAFRLPELYYISKVRFTIYMILELLAIISVVTAVVNRIKGNKE